MDGATILREGQIMLKSTSLSLLSVSLAAMAFSSMSTVAFAQEAAVSDEGGLEDIIVTARKRSEGVQDVPVAVTAISEQVIRERDITSIEKVAAMTPNLNVGRASNGSGAQLTLRGIGSSSTSIGIEQSVAVVVDGVYYGQGRIINEGFFDLAGVEVLKGPQALFFGKNATAGVISIKTADPTDSWEFTTRAGYEIKAEQAQLEFIASGPVGDTAGVRVALRGSKMWGSYYSNERGDVFNPVLGMTAPEAVDGPGEKELLGRLTFKWEPTDKLTATFKASGSQNETRNSSWNYVAFNCGLPSGLSQLNGYACSNDKFVTHQAQMPTALAANFPFAKKSGELYNKYRSLATTANLEYALDDVTITSVTNYNWNNNRWACACDFQSPPVPLVFASENSSFRAFSSELRALTSFDGPLNLMVGGLYQNTKRDFIQFVSFGLTNDPAAGPYQYLDAVKESFTKGKTASVFAQVTWKLLPNLELAGGARYTHETKRSAFVQPHVSAAFAAAWAVGRTTLGDQTFNDWSPEASLTWKPTDDVLVYGAYKTAYKSGGFSNGGIDSLLPGADPTVDLLFDREKARGFEVGVKTTLADNQLRFNVGAFTYKYTDLQVDFFNSALIAFQTLTADARTKGVEVEIEYAPRAVPGLNVRGSINYTDASYTSFPLAPCYAGQTIAAGCNLAGNTRQNLSGAPLSVAPEWTGNFGFGYESTAGESLKWGINVDSRFSSSYLVSGFGAQHSRQGNYISLDAGLRFGAEDDNWQIAVIGKNLTNKLYIMGGVDGPSTGAGTGTTSGLLADQLGFGGLPRTVQVQFTKRF
jgi:iron complex outermembrane recepter protein